MVQYLPEQAGTHPPTSETIFTEVGTRSDFEKVKSFSSDCLPICHFPIVIFVPAAWHKSWSSDRQDQSGENKPIHWMGGIILNAAVGTHIVYDSKAERKWNILDRTWEISCNEAVDEIRLESVGEICPSFFYFLSLYAQER